MILRHSILSATIKSMYSLENSTALRFCERKTIHELNIFFFVYVHHTLHKCGEKKRARERERKQNGNASAFSVVIMIRNGLCVAKVQWLCMIFCVCLCAMRLYFVFLFCWHFKWRAFLSYTISNNTMRSVLFCHFQPDEERKLCVVFSSQSEWTQYLK